MNITRKHLCIPLLALALISAKPAHAADVVVNAGSHTTQPSPRDAFAPLKTTTGNFITAASSGNIARGCVSGRNEWVNVPTSFASTLGTVVETGGIMANGTHTVFATNNPGIGFTMDVADKAVNTYAAITAGTPIRLNSLNAQCGGMDLNIRIKLYQIGTIARNGTIANFSASLPNIFYNTDINNPNAPPSWGGSWSGGLQLSGSITPTPVSCSINSPTNHTINLDTVNISTLNNNPNNMPIVGTATFVLQCPAPSPKITAKASLSDANQPGNTSNILTISTGPDMATGVGIQLFKSSNTATALKLRGADSAMPTIDGSQWLLDNPTSVMPTVTLQARYVRKGPEELRPGRVNATANITFSYQ